MVMKQVKETKLRGQRIPLDYVSKPDATVTLKRILGLVFLVFGFLAVANCFRAQSVLDVSPGELSLVHSAASPEKCESCHTPNVPIRQDAIGGNLISFVAQNNAKCNGQCHQVESHYHATMQPIVRDSQSCAECHREHVGAVGMLLNIHDSQCVRCHGKLGNSTVSGQSQFADVTKFGIETHPEFQAVKNADPGNILFSHAQHLSTFRVESVSDRPDNLESSTTQQVANDIATPTDPARLRLPVDERVFNERYGDKWKSTGDFRLQCSDCHSSDTQAENLNPSENTIGRNAVGHRVNLDQKGFLPLRYEAHCQACHQLPMALPHRIASVTDFESNLRKLASDITLFPSHENNQSLVPPGERTSTETTELVAIAEQRFENLKKVLTPQDQCGKCHKLNSEPDHLVKDSQINHPWFRDATFSHGSHRDVSCEKCHSFPGPSAGKKFDGAAEAARVAIGGIATCAECHLGGPEEVARAAAIGRKQISSGECIKCHRYHRAPMPISPVNESVSSQARNSADLSKLFDFMSRNRHP